MEKNEPKYTDEHELSPGVTREMLGDVKSFLRIISFENGVVSDGVVNPMRTASAIIDVLERDSKMKKLFSIAVALCQIPDGPIRRQLLETFIEKNFPCLCESCIKGESKGHFSEN